MALITRFVWLRPGPWVTSGRSHGLSLSQCVFIIGFWCRIDRLNKTGASNGVSVGFECFQGFQGGLAKVHSNPNAKSPQYPISTKKQAPSEIVIHKTTTQGLGPPKMFLFPSCQVRVVRFYVGHSFSFFLLLLLSPSPPPPGHRTSLLI